MIKLGNFEDFFDHRNDLADGKKTWQADGFLKWDDINNKIGKVVRELNLPILKIYLIIKMTWQTEKKKLQADGFFKWHDIGSRALITNFEDLFDHRNDLADRKKTWQADGFLKWLDINNRVGKVTKRLSLEILKISFIIEMT